MRQNSRLIGHFHRAFNNPSYRFLLFIVGLPIMLWLTGLCFLAKKKQAKPGGALATVKQQVKNELEKAGARQAVETKVSQSLTNKYRFFNKPGGTAAFDKELRAATDSEYRTLYNSEVTARLNKKQIKQATMTDIFDRLYPSNIFRLFFFTVGLPAVVLLLIFGQPFIRYIFERLLMLILVIFGVTWLVFTILYISPLDPAANILGEKATAEQIAQFRQSYGLDQPYLTQLLIAFKNVLTFDFGNAFFGSEPVMPAILRKFPVTLTVTFASLLVSVLIAVPAGIISAVKQYSPFDYMAMIFALIGLSTPNFWLGLMMILLFSVNLGWLNVLYSAGDIKSLIMPAIVLGTALSASCARMTRSSVLEVIKADYITTARAKGVNERTVILKHALRNAVIPVITIVGLQFGAMLGGSAVTEKVFTIPGIGSHIIDSQMLPDIPIVLAGVVYIAIVISLINLVVDILYALFDPRIRARLKQQ